MWLRKRKLKQRKTSERQIPRQETTVTPTNMCKSMLSIPYYEKNREIVMFGMFSEQNDMMSKYSITKILRLSTGSFTNPVNGKID